LVAARSILGTSDAWGSWQTVQETRTGSWMYFLPSVSSEWHLAQEPGSKARCGVLPGAAGGNQDKKMARRSRFMWK
jgi:hypothetical protein